MVINFLSLDINPSDNMDEDSNKVTERICETSVKESAHKESLNRNKKKSSKIGNVKRKEGIGNSMAHCKEQRILDALKYSEWAEEKNDDVPEKSLEKYSIPVQSRYDLESINMFMKEGIEIYKPDKNKFDLADEIVDDIRSKKSKENEMKRTHDNKTMELMNDLNDNQDKNQNMLLKDKQTRCEIKPGAKKADVHVGNCEKRNINEKKKNHLLNVWYQKMAGIPGCHGNIFPRNLKEKFNDRVAIFMKTSKEGLESLLEKSVFFEEDSNHTCNLDQKNGKSKIVYQKKCLPQEMKHAEDSITEKEINIERPKDIKYFYEIMNLILANAATPTDETTKQKYVKYVASADVRIKHEPVKSDTHLKETTEQGSAKYVTALDKTSKLESTSCITPIAEITKQESVKYVTPTTETIKQESVKYVTPTTETIKQESVKYITLPNETTKQESVKYVTPTTETIKQESVKYITLPNETTKQESVKYVTPTTETIKQESVKYVTLLDETTNQESASCITYIAETIKHESANSVTPTFEQDLTKSRVDNKSKRKNRRQRQNKRGKSKKSNIKKDEPRDAGEGENSRKGDDGGRKSSDKNKNEEGNGDGRSREGQDGNDRAGSGGGSGEGGGGAGGGRGGERGGGGRDWRNKEKDKNSEEGDDENEEVDSDKEDKDNNEKEKDVGQTKSDDLEIDGVDGSGKEEKEEYMEIPRAGVRWGMHRGRGHREAENREENANRRGGGTVGWGSSTQRWLGGMRGGTGRGRGVMRGRGRGQTAGLGRGGQGFGIMEALEKETGVKIDGRGGFLRQMLREDTRPLVGKGGGLQGGMVMEAARSLYHSHLHGDNVRSGQHGSLGDMTVEEALGLMKASQIEPAGLLKDSRLEKAGVSLEMPSIEYRQQRHLVMQQFNHCLDFCMDSTYINSPAVTACKICLHLTTLLRHVGRCNKQRLQCERCWMVSEIMLFHVSRCSLSGRMQNLIEEFKSMTSMQAPSSVGPSGVGGAQLQPCAIKFCEKLRQKILQSGELGPIRVRFMWRQPSVWKRLQIYIGRLYEVDLDFDDVEDEMAISFGGLSFYGALPEGDAIDSGQTRVKTLLDDDKAQEKASADSQHRSGPLSPSVGTGEQMDQGEAIDQEKYPTPEISKGGPTVRLAPQMAVHALSRATPKARSLEGSLVGAPPVLPAASPPGAAPVSPTSPPPPERYAIARKPVRKKAKSVSGSLKKRKVLKSSHLSESVEEEEAAIVPEVNEVAFTAVPGTSGSAADKGQLPQRSSASLSSGELYAASLGSQDGATSRQDQKDAGVGSYMAMQVSTPGSTAYAGQSSQPMQVSTPGSSAYAGHKEMRGPVPMVAQGAMMASAPLAPTAPMSPPFPSPEHMSLPSMARGHGRVDYGDRSDLLAVVSRWEPIQKSYYAEGGTKNLLSREGIILKHKIKEMQINDGRYNEGDEWMKIIALGSGMFGQCWLMRDLRTGCMACVKVVPLYKFNKQEVEVWSRLQHPNVVELYGVILDEEYVCMFAEFIDGGTLADQIQTFSKSMVFQESSVSMTSTSGMSMVSYGCLDVRRALWYFVQLLQVLDYLQSKNIRVMHEDIKSDNIMIRGGTGEVVLVDLGLAHHIPSGLVPAGVNPQGAQTHWSPEKAASEGYSFPADLWAMVCVLCEMVTGEPPWYKRYKNAKLLHFVIKMNSPPLDDIAYIRMEDEELFDLFKQGWIVNQSQRPLPVQLWNHPAFAKYGIDIPSKTEDGFNPCLSSWIDRVAQNFVQTEETMPCITDQSGSFQNDSLGDSSMELSGEQKPWLRSTNQVRDPQPVLPPGREPKEGSIGQGNPVTNKQSSDEGYVGSSGGSTASSKPNPAQGDLPEDGQALPNLPLFLSGNRLSTLEEVSTSESGDAKKKSKKMVENIKEENRSSEDTITVTYEGTGARPKSTGINFGIRLGQTHELQRQMGNKPVIPHSHTVNDLTNLDLGPVKTGPISLPTSRTAPNLNIMPHSRADVIPRNHSREAAPHYHRSSSGYISMGATPSPGLHGNPGDPLFGSKPGSHKTSSGSHGMDDEFRNLQEDLLRDQLSQHGDSKTQEDLIQDLNDTLSQSDNHSDYGQQVAGQGSTPASASSHEDISLQYYHRQLSSPVGGILIDFVREDDRQICSVRVRDTSQKWRDIVLRASTRIHQEYDIFTVHKTGGSGVLELNEAVGADTERRTMVVTQVDNNTKWSWRIKDYKIERYDGWYT